MRAAVCRSFDAPLTIEELQIRSGGRNEVSVRVAGCAICRSDVAYAEGAWGGQLPAVYGHEAAGLVEAVGPGVAGLAPGDHVVVTLVRSCGQCTKCRRVQPTLCEGLSLPGEDAVLRTTDGSQVHQGMRTAAFAELVTVDASQAVLVPPSIPFAIADDSLRILGSKMGGSNPQVDIPRLVDLYLSGQLKLDELVSECYELDRINEAIESTGRGEQLRPLVVFP